MILSLTFHEFAHAWMARVLGDDTADREGRLSLNPAVHIDPVGTLLLPVMMLVFSGGSGGGFFGWAKPVPYNPTRFKRSVSMRTGTVLVAAAGPMSNIVLASIVTLVMGLLIRFGFIGEASGALFKLGGSMIAVNVGLAIFNLIPLPPLDGSKVLSGLLPIDLARSYESLTERAGMFPLLAIVIFGGAIMVVPMIYVITFLQGTMLPLIAGV